MEQSYLHVRFLPPCVALRHLSTPLSSILMRNLEPYISHIRVLHGPSILTSRQQECGSVLKQQPGHNAPAMGLQ